MSAIVEYPANATQIVISGQVADDDSGDVRAQTADVLAKIDRYLKEAGSDRSRIVSAYVWLPDIADFDAMNSVWDAWVPAGCGPARACVEGKLANPRLRVEIQVIALKN